MNDNIQATTVRGPGAALRLPGVSRSPLEGWIHFVLSFCVVVAVVQFHSAIIRFIPKAPAFVERVRQLPPLRVERAYAGPLPATNGPAVSLPHASAAPGGNTTQTAGQNGRPI